MPRTARASVGGICCHVVNRGNHRKRVYFKDGDYRAFVDLIEQACRRIPMRVLAYCLMPNHFHFVLWPWGDKDMGRWMHWLLTTHVRRYRVHYDGSTGHVYQGRYGAFLIQDDHLLTVLRYVERNPRRANLVERAEDWPWSSLQWWSSPTRPWFLSEWPVARPRDWIARVNQAQTLAELKALRWSVRKHRPFGSDQWCRDVARRYGLESTLRGPGRPSRRQAP